MSNLPSIASLTGPHLLSSTWVFWLCWSVVTPRVLALTTIGSDGRRLDQRSREASRHCRLLQYPKLAPRRSKISLQLSATSSKDEARYKQEAELSSFLECFQGEFDNYDQVVGDWQDGLRPREEGGHEHMHCRLVPVTNSTRIACFYLDGNPKATFRVRYYSLHLLTESDLDGSPVTYNTSRFSEPFAFQHIYTLQPELEAKIRQSPPNTWRDVLEEHVGADDDDDKGERLHSRIVASGAVEYLPNCDVIWSTTPHPVLHKYSVGDQQQPQQFHALLRAGDEIVVPSQFNPNVLIRIRDQLTLFPDTLYIHDRGRDATTDAWLYGNRREVPYVLQRTDPKDWTSTGVYDVAWYEEKMEAIGGRTAAVRPQSSAASAAVGSD